MTKRTEIWPEECPHHFQLMKANQRMIDESANPKASALAWHDAALHGLLGVYGGPTTLRMMEHSTEQIRLLVAPVDSES